MKKSVKLVGLGCANCAAKMEEAIRKLPEVSAVSINFLTTRMTIEAEREKIDGIVAAAQKIVKNYEPDVKIEKA
ncbi:MAG: heavy metal transporter [Acholeplasmataceae bacterium]|nr:heavy metal transporter [Acholeplasmataceae bacterium]